MADWYPALEYTLASLQSAILMFGMGVTLRPRDFAAVFFRPLGFFLGMFGLLVIGPLLALAFVPLWGLAGPMALGLMLIAVMPGGSVSNVFTFLGRGNVALSVSLTAVMTLASILTIPLLLPLLSGGLLPDSVRMPVGLVLREVVVWLILPVAGGMLFGMRFPQWQLFITRWSVRIAILAVFLIAFGSIGSGSVDPLAHGYWPIAMLAVFLLLTQQLTMLPFRFLRLTTGERLAAGLEVSVRNINFALLLKASLFPAAAMDAVGSGVMYMLIVYGGAAIVISVPTTMVYRWLILREERRQKQADCALATREGHAPHTARTPETVPSSP